MLILATPMSALEGVVEGLKSVSMSLAEKNAKPDRARRDWDRASVDALLAALRERVLQPFEAALAELSDDEHRKFRDVVARVTGSVAAVAGAAGRDDEAKQLLARAAELAASQVARMRLQAASAQLEWHVSLALAEWLGRAGEQSAARKELERIAKHAPEGLIRSEAQAALKGPPEEVEPVGTVPSLFTLNGVGTRLYGRGDAQPDGSYVTTLCFCVLFIPVFPLASYRVADAENGGYYFLGKVKLRRGWVMFRRLLLAGLVFALSGAVISEELGSPPRLARNAIAHAAQTEKSGDVKAAAKEFDEAIELYRGTSGAKELGPALEGWLRLELASISEPATFGQVDALLRLARRVEGLGGADWARTGAAPLLARLRSGATQLGTATPESTEASLQLLAAALGIAPLKEQTALETQVQTLHLEVARGLERWPMWALEHLVLAFPSQEAIDRADAILRALGDSPQVLVENDVSIALWLKATRDAGLAKDVTSRLEAGRALLADPARRELLASRDVKLLEAASQKAPLDQAVAVALAAQLRLGGDLAGASRLLVALGPPGSLTSEALSLRAAVRFEQGELKEGRELLEASVDRELVKLKQAREAFRTALSGAEQRLMAAARRGEVPTSLRNELDTVDEAKGRELFESWLREELEKDTSVLAARERYGQLARVSVDSVGLGSLELQEAITASGEQRDRLLRRAEHHFRAVQEEGEGTAAYQLGYGQVLHRLGRAKEGDALLEAALASGESSEKLAVALAYRQLGLVQRSRQVYEQLWKSEPQPAKDRAAAALAAMADQLEDDELWLSRVETPSPTVRNSLAQARARRLMRTNKFAEADRELATVFAFYEKLAKNDSAAANNAGITLVERYECTGDLAHLDRAVEFLRTSRRLSPESALAVGHLAETLEARVALRLVEPLVHVKQLKLGGSEAISLLHALADGELGPSLRAAMATEPLLRELKEASLSQESLAPGNADSLRRLAQWAALERDLPALRALAARASRGASAYDFSDTAARIEMMKGGAMNDQMRASWIGLRDRLGSLVTDPHGPTRAAALLQRCALEGQLSRLDGDLARARSALADCTAAHAAWPAVELDLSWFHVVIAMLEAKESSPALQEKWKQGAWGDQVAFLSSMLEDEAVSALVMKQPAFADAVRAVGAAKKETLGLSDWLIASVAHEDQHMKRAASALAEEQARLGHELNLSLSAPAQVSVRRSLYERALRQ